MPGPFSTGTGDQSGVRLQVRETYQYITSHRGQLSLAIRLWGGIMSTSQRTVMLCSWCVKAGMVCVWVAGVIL